jgi:fructose-bisphosphate aldolase class 1
MGREQMTALTIVDTAEELLAGDRGILAMDESIGTCDQRFATAGIREGVENRRAYRELLVTTPRLAESIHGAILCDETIRQSTRSGTPMITALTDAAIIAGIKVDAGTVPMAGHPGERVTEGLDARTPMSRRRSKRCAIARDATKWPAAANTAPRQRGRPHEHDKQQKGLRRATPRPRAIA